MPVRDLNPSGVVQAPISTCSNEVVPCEGFEPPTSWFKAKRSAELS